MSLLSRLFGGGGGASTPEPEPETYKDFRIFATPISEGGQWRLAGRIEKELDGTPKSHQLIRADMLPSEAAAITATLAKARQVIDEQGDRLFG